MTITEASYKLFEWFCDNNSINLDDHGQASKIGILNKADYAAFRIALLDYEKMGIIRSFVDSEKCTIFVLEKEMSNFQQSPTISGSAAKKIAETINAFCEKLNQPSDLCNPLSICEKDILNLTYIISYFVSSTEDNINNFFGKNDDGGKDSIKNN
jgi:hypothetical protein